MNTLRTVAELIEGNDLQRLVDKANVLSGMYNLWREAFEEVAADYPEIETESTYVDAITM